MPMNIWWVRRDLRLSDNQALTAALNNGQRVIPVYILDPHLLQQTAEKRHGFLFAGLRELDQDLRCRGSRLIIRSGDPEIEIPRLAAECSAAGVYAEEDISPYARRRDTAVANQISLHLTGGLGAHPIGSVVKPDGTPYKIFTPFSHAWKTLPIISHTLPAPDRLPAVPDLPSIVPADLPVPDLFPPGEREAQRRLAAFASGMIYEYQNLRNRPDLEGTSILSPYFHFGMLSPRQAVLAAQQASSNAPDAPSRAGCEAWINELIWREFYQSILYHFPFVLKTAFKPQMRSIPWRNAAQDFDRWKAGLTGYPIVDAGMRQLAAIGWMHNRVRMIAASFLVKHLLINWQDGERWFMRSLIDGDPASNNGGWQWTAGTGTDAAPYFRVFNPILQGEKFDPTGTYVRRWVPELRNVPTHFIHTPWKMPDYLQAESRAIIGKEYPKPIVDHNAARQRVLEAYALSKSSAASKV